MKQLALADSNKDRPLLGHILNLGYRIKERFRFKLCHGNQYQEACLIGFGDIEDPRYKPTFCFLLFPDLPGQGVIIKQTFDAACREARDQITKDRYVGYREREDDDSGTD